MPLPTKLTDHRDQHAANLVCQPFGFQTICLGPQSEGLRNDKLRLHFAIGTPGVAKEENVLPFRGFAIPFCDVAGH